jgi:hypothetical protein
LTIIILAPDKSLVDTIDPFGMMVEPVKTEFMTDIQVNYQGAGDAYCEAKQINERKPFLAFQVTDEKQEVITDHKFEFRY